MITPDVPSAVLDPPTEVALLVSGMDSLTIARTSQKFNGNNLSGTDGAHLESYETSTGTLDVSNIGSSGLDGFYVHEAIPTTGFARIGLASPTDFYPISGAMLELLSREEGGGLVGSMRVEANAAAQWEISAHFLGSDSYNLTAYDGQEMVHAESGIPNGSPAGFWGNDSLRFIDWYYFPSGEWCIIIGGGRDFTPAGSSTSYGANSILVSSDAPNPVSAFGMGIRGNNLPDFSVVDVHWAFEQCTNGIDDDGDGAVDCDDPDCYWNPACNTEYVFSRGDSNGDGSIDIGDVIAVLQYLFNQVAIDCVAASDVNDDGQVDISDPINLLGYLFGAGAPPVGGTECTPDPDPADPPLECVHSGCP
jgi:hypothetical protein